MQNEILTVKRTSHAMQAIWFNNNPDLTMSVLQWIYRKGNFVVDLIDGEGIKIRGHGREVTILYGTWIVYDHKSGEFMAYRPDLFNEMYRRVNMSAPHVDISR